MSGNPAANKTLFHALISGATVADNTVIDKVFVPARRELQVFNPQAFIIATSATTDSTIELVYDGSVIAEAASDATGLVSFSPSDTTSTLPLQLTNNTDSAKVFSVVVNGAHLASDIIVQFDLENP